MSNIKVIKLQSGEELVAEIINETDDVLEVKNVVAAVLQRRQDGPALGFMPWMHAALDPLQLKKSKIVCVAEVAEEVKNGYNQIYGAGIVVPPKDLILG